MGGRKNVQLEASMKTLFNGEATQVSIRQAVEAFLRLEKPEWSEHTEIWYRERLELMLTVLGDSRPLADLMEVDILDWYASLSGRQTRYSGNSSHPAIKGKLSPYTLHGYARAAKRFFKWLFEKGALPVDLAVGIKLPRLPKQQKKGISDENARAILEAARSNPRDYALITFVESTGVRRGGADNLLLADLNLESSNPKLRRRATVREKGEKERTVIMSEEALRAMKVWLEERLDIDDDHVFLGHSPGQPWHALKSVGISEIFDRYKHQLGLRGPCSPHQWRHRWFRHNLENGMPIGHASQLGGHSGIQVTHDFYGGFSIDELQKAYDRYYRAPEDDE